MNHALQGPEDLIGRVTELFFRKPRATKPTFDWNDMASATDTPEDRGAGGFQSKDLGTSGVAGIVAALPLAASPAEGKNLSTLVSKVPPCQYVVLRGDSATPELFRADNDEQALERLQKEVRAGQTKVVYCYKLMCMEIFVPSSTNIQADDIKSYLAKEQS
jgi:hypothetical protein